MKYEVGDYVQYSMPLRLHIEGVGRIIKICEGSRDQYNGLAVIVKWSNHEVRGLKEEIIEYIHHLEPLPEEDIPLAALMLM
jgi:hypothetical protein